MIAKEPIIFFKDLIQNTSFLKSLIKNDFKQQYLGSYLGLTWSFLQPAFMIAIMWFVFQVGFRVQPVNNIPFILWLSCGMIPWFFFAEAVSQSTNAVIDHSYLVKKIVFRVSLLPLVKVFSALLIHLFFIVLLMLMFLVYGFTPTMYWLQLPYYTICLFVFIAGIGWLTSSINVFFKDVRQVVTILLQFGFWGTPIFWKIDTIPSQYHIILELNPLFYIIEGYRNIFINQIWFWEQPLSALYFSSIALAFLLFGTLVFKRLKPHFADVL